VAGAKPPPGVRGVGSGVLGAGSAGGGRAAVGGVCGAGTAGAPSGPGASGAATGSAGGGSDSSKIVAMTVSLRRNARRAGSATTGTWRPLLANSCGRHTLGHLQLALGAPRSEAAQ
jgi:hypothetical protein